MIKEKEIKEIVEIYGLKGVGSKESPFVIKSFDVLEKYKDPNSNTIRVYDCNYFIEFKSLNCRDDCKLYIKRCSNIILRECTISNLQFYKAEAITILGGSYSRLHITNGQDFLINEINAVDVNCGLCHDIEFRNCRFTMFRNSFSRGNTFIDTDINIFNPRNLVEGWGFNLLIIGFSGIIVAFISLFNVIINSDESSYETTMGLFCLFFLSSAFSIALVVHLIDYIKMRKFMPNKILRVNNV